MWLVKERGELVDQATQLWVIATGRILAELPEWLWSPVGGTQQIGWEFFAKYATERSLQRAIGPDLGLMPALGALDSDAFSSNALVPEVADFYSHTNLYEIEAWAEWASLFRPFGRALNFIFARRLQQLNMPIRAVDTSKGFESEVSQISDSDGTHLFSAWTRRLNSTGNVIYAGAYATCTPPFFRHPCVRVGFPLPNGNAVVIMRPRANSDGSLTLLSAGSQFGDSGFYFTLKLADGRWAVKYLRSLRESIHVFSGEHGQVRADHELTLYGRQFLKIHYKLVRHNMAKEASSVPSV